MVEYRLLGPVEVWSGGRPVEAGQPRQRAVLAALLADAGYVVSYDTMVDRVWGRTPPRDARGTLRVYLSGIRRLLARAAEADLDVAMPTDLVHRSGGYLIATDRDQVDLHRFRRLVVQARAAGASAPQRVSLLREATRLWRGEPLAGITGEWAARMRESWGRERLEAVVAWADAELRLGDPGSVLGTLSDLADEHPLVESVAAVLLRALAAAGRPADAIDHYTRLRHRLAEELGTDPTAELQALYQALLRGELDRPVADREAGGHDSPAAPAQPAAPPRVMPAQLPADVVGFAGRAGHLRRLDSLLAGDGTAPGAAVIVTISGTAGVGKSSLAVHWAHRVAERFPDGQLYVNLRGFDPGGQVMNPVEAVRGLLDALGVPPSMIPPEPDALVGLYRSLLNGRRVLLLLDNARDAGQVRPLLPGSPSCLTVVTSRDQLGGLVAADAAHPVSLDLLTHGEAMDLLVRRLGDDKVSAEPAAAREIVSACARLPLALGIAAARARQTGFSLTALATELGVARDRLDTLDAGDAATRVRTVFSCSYTTLSPAAARLFRLLGLHPGPDVTVPAAASLTGHAPSLTRPLLAELTRATLLTEHLPGRYTSHDLLRAYAADLTTTHDADHDRLAALTRLLDHYTHSAHAADRVLRPNRDPIPLPLAPAAPATALQRPADNPQAIGWFTAERPVLLAVLRRAVETGPATRVWQLAWVLSTFLYRQGHWPDLGAVLHAALHAAEHLAEPVPQAYAHRFLAAVRIRTGRYDDAHAHLRRSLDLYVRVGDQLGQAHAHHYLGYLRERQGRYSQALDHAQQSLALHEVIRNRYHRARAHNAVGWCHALLGEYAEAITHCEQALALFQEVDDWEGQAATWDSLGYAHHELGHHDQALDCYRHAHDHACRQGDRFLEAEILTRLGDTQRATGDLDAARASWRDALVILTELGHPDAERLTSRLDGLREPNGADHR